jgi:hypothetical protein
MIICSLARVIKLHSSEKYVCNCADFTYGSLKKLCSQRISLLKNLLLQRSGAYSPLFKFQFFQGHRPLIFVENVYDMNFALRKYSSK